MHVPIEAELVQVAAHLVVVRIAIAILPELVDGLQRVAQPAPREIAESVEVSRVEEAHDVVPLVERPIGMVPCAEHAFGSDAGDVHREGEARRSAERVGGAEAVERGEAVAVGGPEHARNGRLQDDPRRQSSSCAVSFFGGTGSAYPLRRGRKASLRSLRLYQAACCAG